MNLNSESLHWKSSSFLNWHVSAEHDFKISPLYRDIDEHWRVWSKRVWQWLIYNVSQFFKALFQTSYFCQKNPKYERTSNFLKINDQRWVFPMLKESSILGQNLNFWREHSKFFEFLFVNKVKRNVLSYIHATCLVDWNDSKLVSTTQLSKNQHRNTLISLFWLRRQN